MYTCSMLPPASLAYLDALGIDVWVRRDLARNRRFRERERPGAVVARTTRGAGSQARSTGAGRGAQRSAAATGTPRREQKTDVAERRMPAGEPSVAFTIRRVRFGRVLALIDESLWPERRFFLDVARAMHGPGRVEPEVRRFDWPQLKSADAGMGAAGRAFRAYLETQVVEDTRVLAVGARVRELIGAGPDGHIYLDRALRGPAEKKSLWRRIQKLK